jgi:hypothetical protein
MVQNEKKKKLYLFLQKTFFFLNTLYFLLKIIINKHKTFFVQVYVYVWGNL